MEIPSIAEAIGPFHVAVGAAFNTFTTRKDISPVPIPVIPGGKLHRGTKLAMRAWGEYSTTGTPTMRLGFWLGARGTGASGGGAIVTDIAVPALVATVSGAANFPWWMECEATVTLEGTAGSMNVQGQHQLGATISTFSAETPIPITQALRTVAIDTTIERAIGVSGEFGTSSASNQIIVNGLRVMVWN
jgi:hypothetical protein